MRWLPILWGLVLGVAGARFAFSVDHLLEILLLPGPNSLGESGKVYFAAQFADGELPFASGLEVPYYPSIHGFVLHALPGFIASWGSFEITDLYYTGRAISVAATVGAFVVYWALGRRITSSVLLLALGLLLWAGSAALFQHTTSYRPDNWLLLISLACCWLVIRPLSTTTLASLMLLPVVAFHVKATGLAIGAAVICGLLLRRGLRATMKVTIGQVVLLTASAVTLQWVSDGVYLKGLGAAGSAGFSWSNAYSSLWVESDPLVSLLVASPLVVFALVRRRRLRGDQTVVVIGTFWAVILCCYLVAASRAGSNSYYFLEPAGYGSLVGLAGLDYLREGISRRGWNSRARSFLIAAVVMIMMAAALNVTFWIVRGPYIRGVWNRSMARTVEFSGERFRLARQIEERGLTCFTDAPGLNVLLRNPQVIYPYLQSQLIEQGALPPDLRMRQVRAEVWDCVVLSGESWTYHGTASLPDSFIVAVREYYPSVRRMQGFEVLERASR